MSLELPEASTGPRIAIVSMAGRFPGASTLEQFWANLRAGVDSVSHFPPETLEVSQRTREQAGYVAARSVLADVDLFDAAFFGIYPREAEQMDPQHRVFLECCYEALERGACDPARYSGLIGLFAGCSMNTYLMRNLAWDRAFLESFTEDYQTASYTTLLGNDKDFLPTRVSYKLNLRGPSLAVQSACSTSLVAVCQACQSLLTYGCDAALAGGISITFPQQRGHLPEEGGIASMDGMIRPFDHRAQGTVFGSGAGVVLLKRLEDAEADGDPILGVIRGFALNNDGSAKAGYTAPSAAGQADVIRAAQAMAGVAPASISYVETHGTGTPLGDPIEVAGLVRAFAGSEAAPLSCILGTAKANVGHLDVAAGVVGLIKTVLQLKHREIPGLLHFQKLNPQIDLSGTPFAIRADLTPWTSDGSPLRAGVSAFGVGGTNAHVILEEWQPGIASAGVEQPGRPQLLVLSAKTETALIAIRTRLREHLEAHPELPLPAIARTLAEGRGRYPFRAAVAARSTEEARVQLSAQAAPARAARPHPKMIFVFPGQGAQRLNMARSLYETEPAFRQAFAECETILTPLLGESLLAGIYPENETLDAAARLNQTRLAQPAIFVIEYALAQLWKSFGIEPALLVGHSIGEYVAACLAGTLTLQSALALVAARGSLMQAMPPGSMLAVRGKVEYITPMLGGQLSLAAVNAPSSVVISGPDAEIDAFAAMLSASQIASRKLATSHAFHSAMMDGMIAPFREQLRQTTFRDPALPWISTLTGRALGSAEIADAEYWVRQLREPVAFGTAIKAAAEAAGEDAIFLEVGPSTTVSGSIRQTLGPGADPARVLASLTSPNAGENSGDGTYGILPSLALLWTLGMEPKWDSLLSTEERDRRIELPTYPFERKRYWVQPPLLDTKNETAAPAVALALAASGITRDREPMLTEPLLPSSASVTLISELKTLVTELSDLDLGDTPATTSFVELGLDSLFLTQLTQAIRTRYGIKLTFREIMGEYGSFAALAERLRPHVSLPAAEPVSTVPSRVAQSAPPLAIHIATPSPNPGPLSEASGSTYVTLFAQQMQAMTDLVQRQLQLLERQELPAAVSQAHSASLSAAIPNSIERVKPNGSAAPPLPSPPAPEIREKELGTLVPLKPLELRPEAPLTAQQEEHLDALTRRYTGRTARSKQHAEQFRDVLADPRVASGFHPQFKELVYPIVAERSKGAYLWDTDGNRYIDILNGYGSILFGHSPSFVTDAVHRQLDLGFPIGPQTELAGECARLLAGLTGTERVSFCNTGSEAVMAAIRLARTVTGRSLVVLFSGAYHGMTDEVLVKSTRAERSIPAAPGIPRESVANMLVLEYGSPAALEVIRRRKDEIAAVLVEPVQSRHPALRPVEFLREIREITQGSGSALIFDEVVTGFRTHPGGAQALFGIRADLATYGKVVAGGMPVGVVAGRRDYMDALDGGAWQFGNNSVPQVGVTFFAGTFVRHPLTMAAVKAVLTHLKAEGPSLQQELASKTDLLTQDLQQLFQEFAFPSALEHFSSWFFFPSPHERRLARLLYYHLRERGLHLQEGFPCFLTTTHTDEDLAVVRSTFRSALEAMRDGDLLEGHSKGSTVPTVIPTVSAGAMPVAISRKSGAVLQAPITESQREILLASQIDDAASCAFNESVSLTLTGPLDIKALNRALETLVSRHEVLRMTVVPGGEQIRVMPDGTLQPSLEDWTAFDNSEQRLLTESLLQREATTPFSLITGPLIRSTLVTLSPTHHVLVFTGHHIVLDGWSINVLFGEMGDLYSAAKANTDPKLRPSASFLEFATAEREEGASEEQAEVERFWVEQFRQPPAPLQLPTDRPRPALRSNEGATYRHVFSPEFATLVRQGAQRSGSTLFATLLSGCAALLARFTEQDDLVIAVPMAGQREIEGQSFAGHAVNFLPIRIRPKSRISFAELTSEVKAAVYDALDHQRYTLGTLVRNLKLPRNPSRLELAEVQFNLEQVGAQLRFAGLEAQLTPNPKAAVNADVFFNFIDRGRDLVLECDYSTTLFDPTTVAGWTRSLEMLLRNAAQAPTTPIGDLGLMNDEELRKLLVEWNNTSTEYPRELTVSQVFEDQARRTPEAIALSFADGTANGTLTYAELDRRATMLACSLQQRHRQNAPLRIALSMERSPELITAILAILKCGGMYVPVDPSYPAARLALLIEDAAPDFLLTQQRLVDLFAQCAVEVVRVEELADEETSATLQVHPHGPESAAYMMYTSGSTGKPKGVVVPHRAIVRLVKNTNFAHFGADEVILQLAPISFDASTLEIWGALLNGGRLVLMPGTKPTPEEIGATVQREGVTTMWLTAALFHLMIMDHIELLHPLKQLLAGGDILSVAHVRKLLTASPHLRLINGYGPTENTTFTCCHTIHPEDLEGGSVPIGRPISNTRVYVLDAEGRPVPPGVAGELHAGGDGLAIGYMQAPELTERKFITLDLGPAGVERLYKTGDMARYRQNGTLEFLGRTDSQVKIRGFRVELGEIEYAVEQFPKVRAAIVSARPDWMGAEDVPGDKRLALYVIAEEGVDGAELKRELRQFLRTQLPDHMQPQAIMLVPSFPHTANGKVDHRALPVPEAERALRSHPHDQLDQPRTTVESTLAAIWSKVLQLPEVGIHDSIFELGGDSLSIFRITTQANQAGIQLTAKHIFQYKTIAALSPRLAVSSQTDGVSSTGTITAIPRSQVRKVQSL